MDNHYNRNHNRDGYGRGRGGYNDRSYGSGFMTDRPFEINEPVVHKATGTKLIVINYGREQVECRKPDLTADWFYLYELESYSGNDNVPRITRINHE